MERETLVEAIISVVAVGLFLVVIVAVGVLFTSNHQLVGLGPFALIGSIVFFIVVMSVAGYVLAEQ